MLAGAITAAPGKKYVPARDLNFSQNKIELRSPARITDFAPLEGHDQRLFNAKHGIAFEKRVAFHESMRCHRFITLRCDKEMHMRRSPRMSVDALQHLSDRSIIRNWIGNGFYPAKPVAPIWTGPKDPAIVPFRLYAWLLYIIETIGIVRPDVHESPLHWVPIDIQDPAFKEAAFTLPIERDVVTHSPLWRAFDMERAEDRILGRTVRTSMVDSIDKHRNPENIRKQNIFLPSIRTYLTCLSEKIDGGLPFVRRRFHIFDECMQVTDQRMHNLPNAWIDIGAHTRVDNFG